MLQLNTSVTTTYSVEFVLQLGVGLVFLGHESKGIHLPARQW